MLLEDFVREWTEKGDNDLASALSLAQDAVAFIASRLTEGS